MGQSLSQFDVLDGARLDQRRHKLSLTGPTLLPPGQETFQNLGHFGCRLKSHRRFLRQQSIDDHRKFIGNFRVDLAHGPVRAVTDPSQHAQRRRGPERGAAGAHGVKDGTHAEQVGAVIDGLAAGLLGSHEQGSAGNDPAQGQAGVVHGACQAEVGDLHPLDAILQQDVRGLDVAVDKPLGVCGRQARGGLHADS